MQLEDNQLLLKLRTGDERAVAEWYQSYELRLKRYIMRRIDETQDAEELLQEVFINCLRNLAYFKGKSSLYTWMCSIANHEIADFFRKRYAKKFIHTLPLADYFFSEEVKIENAHALAERMEAAFSKIGQATKELLLLKYVDRKTVSDIAIKHGKTKKAIESDLFRARQAFKAAYTVEEEIDLDQSDF